MRLRRKLSEKQILTIYSFYKTTQRFFIVLALTGMIFSLFPNKNVYATNKVVTSDITKSEMAEQDYYQSSDVDRALVPIVEEDESKRTANEKHFRKLDGTYEVAIYENEVHYYDKGTWYDIDNSFVDDGTKLENKQNAFRVNFPKTINEDKSIQVKTKNYSIDWRVIDIDKTIAFKYNDQGIRTQQVQVTSSGTITIDYSLDGDKVLVESRSNGITLSYTYDVDGTLLSMQYNGNEYFYITNMQGDVIELVDINGNKSEPINTMPGVT